MANLKPIYDAVLAANAEVDRILDVMVSASDDPNEDIVQKALEMQPELEAARQKALAVSALYDLMVKASADPASPASKFVPVNGAAKEQNEGAKTKNRTEFEAMTYQERHDFFANGGTLVDEAAEE